MEWTSRDLLVKYIMQVLSEEGVSFLEYLRADEQYGVRFSQDEIDILKDAERDALKRLKEANQ